MSDAVSAQGAILQIEDATTPDTWIDISEITDFNTPDGEAPDIDVTHLKSAASEFLQGLPDNGNVSLSGNYVGGDEGQGELRTARDAQALRNFKITLTDTPATTFEFSGFVKSYVINAAVNDRLTFSANIRVSGAVTES